MRLRPLGELLQDLPEERELIVAPSGKWTSSRLLEGLAERRARAEGMRVAVQLADTAGIVRALAALDGSAEAIGLFSFATEPEAVVRMARVGSFGGIVTDRADTFAGVKDCPPVFGDVPPGRWAPSTAGDRGDTRWILTTSGTTGKPKMVSHSLKSLTLTTKTNVSRGASITWGLLYDHARFAGLQVVLQSIIAGSRLVAPRPDIPLSDKLALFASEGCTHLSATPTLWRKIAMIPGSERLPLQQITLGGEIADDQILAALTRLFPHARISHVFASTEAGVGFSVIDRRAGFPMSFLDNPPAGIGLAVRDGQLYVRNENVFPAYLGTDTGFSTSDGWIDTGDSVRIENDRVLFLGRANGVINVGGDKVHPEEVERVLLEHPLVGAVRIYAKANPITGALVAADIVLRDPSRGTKEIREELRMFVLSKLERHKVPNFMLFVTDLQLSAAGKVARP